MKIKNTADGYILVLALSIITLAMMVVTIINNKVNSYIPFARATVERQKAHTLAFGGVQLALSQLATAARGTQKQKPTDVDHAKELLLTLLPVLNRWQSFDLKRQLDGLDGELKICITSEEGKINVNQIYDFKAKKFIKDYQKIMTAFFERLTPLVHGVDLFKGFEKFLKERQDKIQDVTELLTIKEFEIFKNRVFYVPAVALAKEGVPTSTEAPSSAKATEGRPKGEQIYLTDLFTIWTDQVAFDPWLMSHSLSTLFNGEQPKKVKDREAMNEQLKNFALKMTWNAQSWDTMIQPLYGISFKSLPEFASSILSDTFEPTTFCVLSQAKVGTITQRLLAIVQRDASAPEGEDASFGVTIKKLYWL